MQHGSRSVAVGLLVAALVLPACTDSPSEDGAGASSASAPSLPDDGAASSSAPRSSGQDEAVRTTAPAPPEPAVEVEGVSEPVADLALALYAGDDVPASAGAQEALTGAEAATQDTTVRGAEGTWHGEPYAVLSAGADLTVAVEGDDGWRVVGGVWPSLGVDEPALGAQRHVLMIGSDAREKRGEPVDRLRADSLQVIGVDGAGGGGVMGIARDAWVDMPDGGQAKINTAMVRGGPEAQVEAVAGATGLPIEGYVLVGFQGFAGFVDDWGGVSIDSPRAFDGFPEGVQELNGYWLLRWTRHRQSLPGGDFDRSRHQGIALAGIGLQARAAGPLALPEVLALVEEHMESDLDAEQVLTLACWAYLAKPEDFGHEVAAGDVGWSSDGQSIVRWDEQAREVFADFADGNLG